MTELQDAPTLGRAAEIRSDDDDDRRALAVFTLGTHDDLSHEQHVRAARLYLQQLSLGAAIDRYTDDLRRYTTAHGANDKFHFTITVAFLLVIRARLATAPEHETFAAFIARNPDLRSARCLDSVYTKETLASPLARRDFVFPDRATRASA